VDLDLVRATALARPRWSFVLVGKQATGMGAVRDLPNVRLLGQKPYTLLPAYCRGFDVGIIPFRTNDLTRRANPLKLREYLAAGLPVVTLGGPAAAGNRAAPSPRRACRAPMPAPGPTGRKTTRDRTD
jgi:glycosyltransferase involved in cell wall biosynthesis